MDDSREVILVLLRKEYEADRKRQGREYIFASDREIKQLKVKK